MNFRDMCQTPHCNQQCPERFIFNPLQPKEWPLAARVAVGTAVVAVAVFCILLKVSLRNYYVDLLSPVFLFSCPSTTFFICKFSPYLFICSPFTSLTFKDLVTFIFPLHLHLPPFLHCLSFLSSTFHELFIPLFSSTFHKYFPLYSLPLPPSLRYSNHCRLISTCG